MSIPPRLVAQIDQQYPVARAVVLSFVESARGAMETHGAPVTAALISAEFLEDFPDPQQLAGMLGIAVVELARHLSDEEVADATG